jgi:hypothetical protein
MDSGASIPTTRNPISGELEKMTITYCSDEFVRTKMENKKIKVYKNTSDPKGKQQFRYLTMHRGFIVYLGIALIINILNFEGHPEIKRNGSEHDVERLSYLFDAFGYNVVVKQDLKAKVLLITNS